MKKIILGLVAAAATLGLAVGPAHADSTEPYGDDVTGSIANQLHGTHRGAWLATVLDQGGYHGRRHAEVIKIPDGHGTRWAGVIHVPAGNAARVRHALAGQWFAKRGTRFVLPLRSSTWTSGGSGARYHNAAKWADRTLGSGWKVDAP